MVELRQPVVVVLGHVDSGKTSLLDRIRGTAVQAREVGGITQHIGASFFPVETVKEITGPLFNKLAKSESLIPGLLVIDTPGHEVFANLRVRGGSAADTAGAAHRLSLHADADGPRRVSGLGQAVPRHGRHARHV